MCSKLKDSVVRKIRIDLMFCVGKNLKCVLAHACVHVCLCVCACARLCVHMYECGNQRTISGIILQVPATFVRLFVFLSPSLTGLELAKQTSHAGYGASRICLSAPSELGCPLPRPAFPMMIFISNSDPCACKPGSVLTEYPRPPQVERREILESGSQIGLAEKALFKKMFGNV